VSAGSHYMFTRYRDLFVKDKKKGGEEKCVSAKEIFFKFVENTTLLI